jgi:hypothetical protein
MGRGFQTNRSSAKRVKGEFDGVQLVKGASATTSKTTKKKSARKGSGGGVLEIVGW